MITDLVDRQCRGACNHSRAITGASLVALVRSGAKFENRFLVERDETVAA